MWIAAWHEPSSRLSGLRRAKSCTIGIIERENDNAVFTGKKTFLETGGGNGRVRFCTLLVLDAARRG